ncbi:MAG: hypothetical protein MRY63_09165 [Neomegalonema sp.]|nr:hypothetical protein [Neomegalonema sp.]
MTDRTSGPTGPEQDSVTIEVEDEKRKPRLAFWLLLLVLLPTAIGGYFVYDYLRARPAAPGSFSLNFTGCDAQSRCASFKLIAPGYEYRWSLGKAEFDLASGADGTPVEPDLLMAIGDELYEAQGVIAAGMASREAEGFPNRALSSCRSRVLADKFAAASAELSRQLPIHRTVLGRYGEAEEEGVDTSIERLVIFALITGADQGVDLSAALKAGLLDNLPTALQKVLSPVARQLDFRRYECWERAFAVTPNEQVRQICYDESKVPDICDQFD